MSMTTANLEAILIAPKALSAADVARLKKQWDAAYSGSNANRIAVLDYAPRHRRDPYFWQPAPLVIQSPSALLAQATIIGGTAVALLSLLI